jgi:hypothetical protein
VDFTGICQRLAWVLARLRHQRAREPGLIYEACHESFGSDTPRDAGDPRRMQRRRWASG